MEEETLVAKSYTKGFNSGYRIGKYKLELLQQLKTIAPTQNPVAPYDKFIELIRDEHCKSSIKQYSSANRTDFWVTLIIIGTNYFNTIIYVKEHIAAGFVVKRNNCLNFKNDNQSVVSNLL